MGAAQDVRTKYPMGTRQDEGRALERFRSVIEASPHGAKTWKLHGGIYQNGLPDLDVCGIDGALIKVEMKVAWNQRCTTYQHAFDLLRTGKQRSMQQIVCMELGLRSARAFIVIGDCVEVDGDKAWTCMWLGNLREVDWASTKLRWSSLDRVVGYVLGEPG